ncbi:BrnA antitoxin family protein [candidate division KSB1 bacterium]|nr:BrnA antitoxin family protein [candidate division KSB1 bacterium]
MQKSNDKKKHGRTKKEARDPVPKFKSLEEEIEFWENHDLTKYRDYWREVKNVKIELNCRHFRIEDELAKKIGQLARQRGVSSETLMNLWVQQKLSETLKRDKRRQRASSKRAPTYPKSRSKRTIGISQYA